MTKETEKPDTPIDYERLVREYQIENEILRSHLNRKTQFFKEPKVEVDFNMKDIIDWVEKNYLFIIAVCFVVNCVVSNAIDIIDRRNNHAR